MGAAVSKRGPRGPYASGREAQRVIIDAAHDVFAERGYRGGSIRDVAERAGVSAANVIHHFGSKQAVLVAVLQARDLGSRDVLDEPAERGDIVEGLRSLVRSNAADPGVVRLFATLAAEATEADHPAHEYFRDRYVEVRAAVTQGITAARAHGRLPAGPPAEKVAAALVAVMDGLQLQWLLDETFDMVAAFDAHLRVLGAPGV